MDAAVLHTLGKPPRFEQFPEPIAGDGEVIVHVHAASLKPIDKQLASGSHYASPRDLPRGTDGVGHLCDGQRVFFGGGAFRLSIRVLIVTVSVNPETQTSEQLSNH